MTHIAVLGLGAMGARMATRLIAAGHDVCVYNRTAERAAPLQQLGARIARSPRDAAEQADIVIAMVTDDAASRALWLDKETGALAALGTGALAIESSTLTPAWVSDLAAAAAARGVGFLDAPVAGSRPQAEAGQLIYLVGGAAPDLERAKPVLAVLGGAIHHVGPVGQGTAMKLAVNAFFGVQVAAMGEVLGLLRRAGVATDAAAEILGALPVTSPALKGIAGLMAARNFAPLFPIDLVAKDFHYIAAAAQAAGADLPVAAAAGDVFTRAKDAGLGGDNIAGVVQLFD